MAEALEKFKELVEGIKTVTIKTGRQTDINKASASLILHKTLILLGKESSCRFSGTLPENVKGCLEELFSESMENMSQNLEPTNVVINVDSNKIPVDELKYEKAGETLKIILKTKKLPDLSAVSVKKEPIPADLLILMDAPEKELQEILESSPHKEIVKIGTKNKELGKKTAELVKALAGKFPEDLKEALWFLIKEEEKTSPSLEKEFLNLKTEIAALGPDEAKLSRAQNKLRGKGFIKLLGRALARSHEDEEAKTFWSFLPHADFEKTGADENSALNILNELRAINSQNHFFALLYENGPKNIKALVASPHKEKLHELASMLATSPYSSYFIADGFTTFSEAELKLRSLIRRVL